MKLDLICFAFSTLLLPLEIESFSKSLEAMTACLISKGLNQTQILVGHKSSNRKSYIDMNYQFNRYFGKKTPLAYILPSTVQHVQFSVICARLFDIPIVAKGGGFSYTKYCFGDSETVVIDLRRLDQLTFNSASKTAEIGPGNLMGKVTAESNSWGYFFPVGLCPWVGISYSLGGGYSLLSRSFGLAVDSMTELDLVDSSGRLLTANAHTNSDLFWALRGGGTGGSFGIVTRYKFSLRPIPKQVIYSRNQYSISMFPKVFDAFQKYCSRNPARVFNFILTTQEGTILVELVQVISHNATYNAEEFIRVLESNFPIAEKRSIQALSYLQFIATAGAYGQSISEQDLGKVSRKDYGPFYFKAKSFYARSQVGGSDLPTIDALIQRAPKYILLEFQANGGAINDFRSDQTAYFHRAQNIYKLEMDYLAPVGRSGRDERKALEWLRQFFEVTRRIVNHTESYVNNSDEELEDYLTRYYGRNLRRLRKIKGNMIHKTTFVTHNQFHRSIRSMCESAPCSTE